MATIGEVNVGWGVKWIDIKILCMSLMLLVRTCLSVQ